jgi:hypothetical protein
MHFISENLENSSYQKCGLVENIDSIDEMIMRCKDNR